MLADEHIGTFVGLSLEPEVARELEALCTHAEVPKLVSADGLHVTLIYSRRALKGFTPAGSLDIPIMARPSRYVSHMHYEIVDMPCHLLMFCVR